MTISEQNEATYVGSSWGWWRLHNTSPYNVHSVRRQHGWCTADTRQTTGHSWMGHAGQCYHYTHIPHIDLRLPAGFPSTRSYSYNHQQQSHNHQHTETVTNYIKCRVLWRSCTQVWLVITEAQNQQYKNNFYAVYKPAERKVGWLFCTVLCPSVILYTCTFMYNTSRVGFTKFSCVLS